jgi:iron complex outermembrane receptor protein
LHTQNREHEYRPLSNYSLPRCIVAFAILFGVTHSFAQETVPVSTNLFILDEIVVRADESTPLIDTRIIQSRTLLDAADLQLKIAPSLGDTLMWEPGITSSSFGPGSSRPVIRGFSGDRVRMLSDGVGTGDISQTSPDHAVTAESLLSEEIEVLRGPSTLEFGGSAIGGVVNVKSKSIPRRAPAKSYEGVSSLRWESASRERTGVTALTLGNENLALQFNVLRSISQDYDIPGKARLNPRDPTTNPEGTLPNTWTDRLTASGGIGTFWEKGRVGASITRIESEYGVPFHADAHSHFGPGVNRQINDVAVDLDQIRFNGEFELYNPIAAIDEIELRGTWSDYQHAESEAAATLDNNFGNTTTETKLDLTHARFRGLSGRIGGTWRTIDFGSRGPEVNTPDSQTENFAGYVIENLELGPLKLQAGGRFETQIMDVNFANIRQERLTYDSHSLSAGLELQLWDGFEIAANWSRARRPPNSTELFSNGPHLAAGTFEVGAWYRIPFLKPAEGGIDLERSENYEFSLRKTKGRLTGSVTYFTYNFDNYIFVTGIGPGWEVNGLPIFRYIQTRAKFEGAELQLEYELLPASTNSSLTYHFSADSVRATDLNQDTAIPRFPPVRVGNRVEYSQGPWKLGAEVRHSFAQNRLQRNFETPTKSYTLLNADLTHTRKWGNRDLSLFIKGNNLLNADARNHVSVAKDVAPLPGRSVGIGATLTF